jgi:homogentisate 1,2-dioxygenase
LPHGPQPGLAEKSIGIHETHELAVMCDTFYPLKLTKFASQTARRQNAPNFGSGSTSSVADVPR